MRHRAVTMVGLAAIAFITRDASARPVAPKLFCETYPDAPACYGATPECTLCHHDSKPPPATNPFGDAVATALEEAIGAPPYEDADFEANLATLLVSIEDADSDDDGISNIEEIEHGSRPGDAKSTPKQPECPENVDDLDYKLCVYDPVFVVKRIGRDVCGAMPAFEEMEAFRALDDATRREALHDLLDLCVKTDFWRGLNGVVWQLAHRKVRPLLAFAEFAAFEPDYNLFTYAHTDGHDVRDILLASYLVTRFPAEADDGTPITLYDKVDAIEGQPMQPDKRVGMLTTTWQLFYSTMFTALPRATAAQAYRSFLNMDIALSEGLEFPVAGEPIDYDGAGVRDEACATCHATLDPLSYPFSRYNGLQGEFFTYDPNRMMGFASINPDLADVPEQGYIFGTQVADLGEWAQVAASSDAFYAAVTEDYWKILVGTAPTPDDGPRYEEFVAVWQTLRDDPSHSVEAMLHHLIDTEAYGAP